MQVEAACRGGRQEAHRAIAQVCLVLAVGCAAPLERVVANDTAPVRSALRAPHLWGGWHRIDRAELGDPATSDDAALIEGLFEEAADLAMRNEEGLALASLRESLASYPEAAQLHEASGALHLAFGYLRAAEYDFEEALALDDTRASAWAGLGRTRLELRLPRRSVAALERAAELGRDGPCDHLLLARAQRCAGRLEASLHHYAMAFGGMDESSRAELAQEVSALVAEFPAAQLAELESDPKKRPCVREDLRPVVPGRVRGAQFESSGRNARRLFA